MCTPLPRLRSAKDYTQISDLEWYGILSSHLSADAAEVRWFFESKCYSTLIYLNDCIMREHSPRNLFGLFYSFVSRNNWYVIRAYKGINGASLETWLRKCAGHYFRKIKKKIDLEEKQFISLSENPHTSDSILLDAASFDEAIEEAMHSKCQEDENVYNKKIYRAFSKLNERDQLVMKLLIIECHKPISVAKQLFAYRNGGMPLEEMSPKQVQDTIAIMKKRACAKLLTEYQKLT